MKYRVLFESEMTAGEMVEVHKQLMDFFKLLGNDHSQKAGTENSQDTDDEFVHASQFQ